MKHVKMLGLLTLAVGAFVASAGTASGSKLTDYPGLQYGVGGKIAAISTQTSLDGTINLSCQASVLEGEVTDAGGYGGSTRTVKVGVTYLHFAYCGNHTVEVKKGGMLEIHGTASGDGTLTWSGAEITVLTHSLFLGTRHCIYVTNNTHFGTLKRSVGSGHASISVDSAPIPQSFTDFICGNDAEWTGSYVITTPATLYVD